MVTAIHIEIDALFFLLLCVIAFQSARNVSQQMSRVLFRYTVYGIMFSLALDILWLLVDGKQFAGAAWMNAVINALYLASGVAIGGLWYLYVLETLGIRLKRPLVCLVMAPGAVFTLLNLITIGTGWIFYIDESNFYQRGPLFWLQEAAAIAVLLIPLIHIIIRLLDRRPGVPRRNVVKLLRFYIIPVVGMLATLPFAGMPGTWTCAAASVILMYMDDQDGEISRDSLTGLNNRKTLSSAFAEYSRAVDEKTGLFLFMIDLNEFKKINDTLGHPTGDQALTETAGILRKASGGRRALVARVGGDEFLIMGLFSDGGEAEAFRRKLKDSFERFNTENDRPYRLSAGVGFAAYAPGQSLDSLIAAADEELYKQKNEEKTLRGA